MGSVPSSTSGGRRLSEDSTTSSAKIGLAFGGIILGTLLIILAYHLWKRHRKRRKQRQQADVWSTVIVNSPLRAVAMLTSTSINANAPTSNMLYQPQHTRSASGETDAGVVMTPRAAPASGPAIAPADVATSRKQTASGGGKKVHFVASEAEDDASSGSSAPPVGGRSFAMRAVQFREDDAPVAVKSVSVRRLRTDSDPEAGAGGGDTW